VQDIKRTFNSILDLGSGPGHLSKLLETDKVKKSIMLDSSGGCTTSEVRTPIHAVLSKDAKSRPGRRV